MLDRRHEDRRRPHELSKNLQRRRLPVLYVQGVGRRRIFGSKIGTRQLSVIQADIQVVPLADHVADGAVAGSSKAHGAGTYLHGVDPACLQYNSIC